MAAGVCVTTSSLLQLADHGRDHPRAIPATAPTGDLYGDAGPLLEDGEERCAAGPNLRNLQLAPAPASALVKGGNGPQIRIAEAVLDPEAEIDLHPPGALRVSLAPAGEEATPRCQASRGSNAGDAAGMACPSGWQRLARIDGAALERAVGDVVTHEPSFRICSAEASGAVETEVHMVRSEVGVSSPLESGRPRLLNPIQNSLLALAHRGPLRAEDKQLVPLA